MSLLNMIWTILGGSYNTIPYNTTLLEIERDDPNGKTKEIKGKLSTQCSMLC